MNTIARPNLWMRFVRTAQPYFFPLEAAGGKKTLLLLVMLLLFLFGVLFVVTSGLVVFGRMMAPELAERIAGGLLGFVDGVFGSPALLLVAGSLLLPAGVGMLFRRQLFPRRQAWLLLSVVLLLSLSVTGINVAFSYIGNYFTNALVQKNRDAAYLFVTVYFCGFLLGIPIVAFYGYVRDYLGMRWREWMTRDLVGKYFSDRNYYEIESRGEIDNPDQRIMEDIRSFTRVSLAFLLIILGAFMDLVSFAGILWSKSRLLVGVVLVYSVVGTLVTAWIGRRLVRLNFDQLRYEADFRYALVHVRDNTESIAFYQGEKPEMETIGRRFSQAIRNFGLLIGWQRNLGFLTTAYSYLPVVLPYLVLFPAYFRGTIEYGDMVQANFAFTQVYAALSLIVSQIEEITGFAAGVQRLSGFSEALSEDRGPDRGIGLTETNGFALDELTLQPPTGTRELVRGMNLDLAEDDNLVIVGPSGVGKSSLLRAVAGLWRRGSGTVHRPPLDRIFFLPQKPYMLLGNLREQLLYPQLDRAVTEERLREVLESVQLSDLPDRVGGFDAVLDWADVLSLGEQQRLAFARLLVNRPGYAVLDEATSALDAANEANVYNRLRELGIRYISVGHRPTILGYHTRVLKLQGPERWRLMPVADYMAESGAGSLPA